jgi:hypothetical protein
VESPRARPADGGPPGETAPGPSWSRSPRFWLAAVAAGALVLAVGSGIEAIRVEPIRLGFAICAVSFLAAAGGCAVAAITRAWQR